MAAWSTGRSSAEIQSLPILSPDTLSPLQVGLHATLAAMHPNSARVAPDDDGLLPEWLAYHSMVATARVFLVKVGPPIWGLHLWSVCAAPVEHAAVPGWL